MAGYAIEMILGAVTDIRVPAIMREFFVKAVHVAIARDLGKNGSRRDRQRETIAFDDRFRIAFQLRRELTVY